MALQEAVSAMYIHDLDTGLSWTPTALPIRDAGRYVARHGFGYSGFEHMAHSIAATMVQFVPMDDPVKITRLTLHNTGATPRNLSVTAYAEWVLGTARRATAAHIITSLDAETGAILGQNRYTTAFQGRIAFGDFGARTNSALPTAPNFWAGAAAWPTQRGLAQRHFLAEPEQSLPPAPPCNAA